MSAPIILWSFYVGDFFRKRLTFTDVAGAAVDLTGYGIRSQMRSADGTLVATFVTTFASPRTLGVVDLELSIAVTGALKPGRYAADIKVDPPSAETFTLASLYVIVNAAVTA